MVVPKALAKAAASHGLEVIDRGNGHYQIIGGALLVNYYPDSKRKSAYIAGMVSAHHGVDENQAVSLALKPKATVQRDKRQKTYVPIKKRLYKKSNLCYRCGQEIIVFSDATLEHIVPLSKGGLDNPNNMALSHEGCNLMAGNSMPRKKA